MLLTDKCAYVCEPTPVKAEWSVYELFAPLRCLHFPGIMRDRVVYWQCVFSSLSLSVSRRPSIRIPPCPEDEWRCGPDHLGNHANSPTIHSVSGCLRGARSDSLKPYCSVIARCYPTEKKRGLLGNCSLSGEDQKRKVQMTLEEGLVGAQGAEQWLYWEWETHVVDLTVRGSTTTIIIFWYKSWKFEELESKLLTHGSLYSSKQGLFCKKVPTKNL